MKVKWTGSPQESHAYGSLVAGQSVEVSDDVAAAWIEAGVAEAEDTGAKRRRLAAPEPAPEA